MLILNVINNHNKYNDDSYSYEMKLIMSENNTNKNSMDNLIRQNVNCHSQCDDQIFHYNMNTWTKKSFSRKAHKDIKLMKYESHCLLQIESLSMA
jgi:hypothetical protein